MCWSPYYENTTAEKVELDLTAIATDDRPDMLWLNYSNVAFHNWHNIYVVINHHYAIMPFIYDYDYDYDHDHLISLMCFLTEGSALHCHIYEFKYTPPPTPQFPQTVCVVHIFVFVIMSHTDAPQTTIKKNGLPQVARTIHTT